MATKYRVYNELSEDEKAQIATEKQWHKRGYCPVENEGELMYCNRSWSKAVYFRADQVRRMSETELALIRAERSAKDAAKRAKERAVALAEQEAQRKRENLNIYRQKCAAICAAVSKRPTNLKLVFDLETTGLNFAEDEILEAAITTVDGEVLFESRFKPAYTKEWSGAQRVNGISPEDVEDAPGIIDKIGEMAALLQNAETVIAYNGKQFDIPFLERYGIRLRPDAVIDDPMLYGAVVYGELRGEGEDVNYKWKKLAVLADYLGYKGANWHSAAADCIATAYVWRQLQESDMIEKYNENLAKLNEDEGIWYVTGHTDKEASATAMHPVEWNGKKGQIILKGVEDDQYIWTELETANGYTLLKNNIDVTIKSVDDANRPCDIYGKDTLGVIQNDPRYNFPNNEDYKLANIPQKQLAHNYQTASATVDGNDVTMLDDEMDTDSTNAIAPLTVVNTRVFITPMTGDRGTQALAIGGVLVFCLGTSAFIFFLVFKRRKEQEDK